MEGRQKSKRGHAEDEPMCKKPKISPDKVKLSIGDTVIVADKERLISASLYFASLLRFHADDNLETVSLVPPENTDPKRFLAVLNTLVDTDIKLNITATNLREWIALSEYFQVEQLKEECLKAFREMLLTLTMDELVGLWRYGQESAIGSVTSLALEGISLKMESARQSEEFLDLSTDELVALMSDDGFLPLTEQDVCMSNVCAQNAYATAFLGCHSMVRSRSRNRKKHPVLEQVLVEVVWDDSVKHLTQLISPQCRKPNTMPKRTVNSDGDEIPDEELLEDVDASSGIIVENSLFCTEDSDYESAFCRIDMNSKEREDLESIYFEVPCPNGPEYQSTLFLVKLPDGDRIGCFLSYRQTLQYLDDGGYVTKVANSFGLYDITTKKWRDLPLLPLTRVGCTLIQCGSFVYVIGGQEYRVEEDDRGIDTHQCYRLDVVKFTAERRSQWERIADLHAPRIKHSVKLQYGRIIVHGGQTLTDPWVFRGEDFKRFEEARWSEAYDPVMNSWIVFGSAS